MSSPLVSVIIPTYNRAAMVREAVESVFRQTFVDFQLIVVDDGSTDDTSEALSPFRPRLTYLYQAHRGVSAARNLGIEAALGRWIAFLDSDDLWLPEKLKAQVEFFRQNPEARVNQTEEIWIRKGRRVNPKKKHKKISGDLFAPSLKLCLVSPSAVMIEKALFNDLGGFDESLPACEDYDLWLRISARHPIFLIDRPLVIKRGGHPDQLSRTIPFLDRFRIQALIKILDSGGLRPEQSERALQELEAKCRVYGQGCLKRGKTEEGKRFLQLPTECRRRFSKTERDRPSDPPRIRGHHPI